MLPSGPAVHCVAEVYCRTIAGSESVLEPPRVRALMSYDDYGQPVGEALPDWRPPPSPRRSTLAGRHCRLEPLDVARHAQSLHAAQELDREGRNWTYLPYGPFADEPAYRLWLANAASTADPLFFAVCDARTGRALGVASHLSIRPEVGVIEVGHIHFSEALKRTPAATEALFLMIDRAFALGFRRVEWKCDALNTASRAAAKRLGFAFEGVFRQASVYKGRNRDTAWYAMIDGDWVSARERIGRWLEPGNFDASGRQRQALGTLRAECDQVASRRPF